MAKQYWAVYDGDTLTRVNGKHDTEAEALGHYLANQADVAPGDLNQRIDSVRGAALGTVKSGAEDTFAELKKAHQEYRNRRLRAEADVEDQIIRIMRQDIASYEDALDAFTHKVRQNGPAEAIRWAGDNIMEHEFNADQARQVLRLVTRGDKKGSGDGMRNPVKALRWVLEQVRSDLLDNRYASNGSGMFTTSTGAARQAAASHWQRRAAITWLLHQADDRDTIRAELSLNPIDYEAAWAGPIDATPNPVEA